MYNYNFFLLYNEMSEKNDQVHGLEIIIKMIHNAGQIDYIVQTQT